jgi:hypothetical protein
MPRRAGSSSQRGLLLVEAVLSAVVIAVGLVFISRSLTSQLKALRTMEEHEVLLSLAHGKLGELEAERLADLPPTHGRPEGSFEWMVDAALRGDLEADADGRPLFSEVTLTVRHGDDERRSSAVTLSAIWLTRWVPAEWY